MGVLRLKDINPYLGPKEDLIREGLKTVRKIAGRYRPLCYAMGIDLEDIISEGTIGLLLAYDRYDPSRRGSSFNAFSGPYIKGHILDYIRDKTMIIRLPQRPSRLVNQVFQGSLESEPPEKVARHLGISSETAENVLQLTRLKTVKSLNRTMSTGLEDSGSELIDFIKCQDDLSEIIVMQFIDTLNPSEKMMLSLMTQGFKHYEVARRLSISRAALAEMLEGVQRKAVVYFGLDRGSEGQELQKRFQVTKEQYTELRAKGLTDARIAEKLGMGDTALYKRKKEWGLVESKSSKATSPELDNSPRMDQEVSRLNLQIAELEMKLSRLESENGLLWDMVKLLKA
ncbi:sigma factor [Paenibacillus glucanolyticus]|uniref:sigma factor n=1 Tax=Paenibacillus glucanolyticus TaxID=59843 RepID=UPI0035DDC60F